MKKIKETRTNFEKMLEIFDNTCKIACLESRTNWLKALEENKWTDAEFDAELTRRSEKKSA